MKPKKLLLHRQIFWALPLPIKKVAKKRPASARIEQHDIAHCIALEMAAHWANPRDGTISLLDVSEGANL
jgi:hypothetical protein